MDHNIIRRIAEASRDSELESAAQLKDWPYAEQIIKGLRERDPEIGKTYAIAKDTGCDAVIGSTFLVVKADDHELHCVSIEPSNNGAFGKEDFRHQIAEGLLVEVPSGGGKVSRQYRGHRVRWNALGYSCDALSLYSLKTRADLERAIDSKLDAPAGKPINNDATMPRQGDGRQMISLYVDNDSDAALVLEALSRLKEGGPAVKPFNQNFAGIKSLDWDTEFEAVEGYHESTQGTRS